MKTNPNNMIHSFKECERYDGNLRGLTKREYFSAILLSGYMGNSMWITSDLNKNAELAVRQADALIAELNKEAK
jgi:hypothetical protein